MEQNKGSFEDAIRAVYEDMEKEVKAISDELRENAIAREKERSKPRYQADDNPNLTKEEERKARKEFHLAVVSEMMDRADEYEDLREETEPRFESIKEKYTPIFKEIYDSHNIKIREWATSGDLGKTITDEWNVKPLGKKHLNTVEIISNSTVPKIKIHFTKSSVHIETPIEHFLPKFFSLKKRGVDIVLSNKKTASADEIIVNLSKLNHMTGKEFVKDVQGNANELGGKTTLYFYKFVLSRRVFGYV